MFQSVHSSVCHLDLLIQGQERSLKGSCLDQKVQNHPELFSALLDWVSSSLQTNLTHSVVGIFVLLQVQIRNQHTCDVFVGLVKTNCGSLDSFRHFSPESLEKYWNYPAAYFASAIRKKASLQNSPILFLLSRRAFMISLNFFLRASAFLLSSSWPFLAAAIFCLNSCRFLHRGELTFCWLWSADS